MNIVIVGRPRSGKTHFAKALAVRLGFPLVVNDENAEWGQAPRDLSEFMDIVDKRHGVPTTFVWEEATGYLGNIGGTKADERRVVRALVRRFHTKHVNILLFHSIRAVPVWVMDYADTLVLFPTADRPSLVASKFKGWDAITEAFSLVNDPRREVVAISPRGDVIRRPVEVAIFGT